MFGVGGFRPPPPITRPPPAGPYFLEFKFQTRVMPTLYPNAKFKKITRGQKSCETVILTKDSLTRFPSLGFLKEPSHQILFSRKLYQLIGLTEYTVYCKMLGF